MGKSKVYFTDLENQETLPIYVPTLQKLLPIMLKKRADIHF